MFDLDYYDFHLPEELIAHFPVPERDTSSLLKLDRNSGSITHKKFYNVVDYFKDGDVLVLNNTRVIPARVYGKKESGGKVEILILDYTGGKKSLEETGFFECDCLIKASKRPKEGSFLQFDDFKAEVTGFDSGVTRLRFHCPDIEKALDKSGEMPLPPYIQNQEGRDDKKSYQTVYAKEKGAVAAPTAGLHFTEEILQKLRDKGVTIVFITLHVGYGTFVPVRVSDIRDHKMHSEFFTISEETANVVNKAKDEGRRVLAVGTTSVRTLEYAAFESGVLKSGAGNCDLFIYPGFEFKIIDGMITNFHLPKSTLMMLISAFAGHDNVMNAYKEAIEKRYRFFSYGDSMLII